MSNKSVPTTWKVGQWIFSYLLLIDSLVYRFFWYIETILNVDEITFYTNK